VNNLTRSDQHNEVVRMSAIVERRAVIGGYATRVLELPGSGAPLLLLHGFADTADTWRPLMAELARSGRRTVAVDLPGFGDADDPPAEQEFLPPRDRFVAAAIEHLGEKGRAPVVAGNSLGGVLALRAVQNPDLSVSGAVVISPAGFGHPRWVSALGRTKGLEAVLFRPVVPMPVYRFLVNVAVRRLAAGHPRQLLPGEAARFARQFRTHADVRRLLGGMPTVLPEAIVSAENPSAPTAPLQALWGRRDRLTLVSGAVRLHAAYPTAEIELLDGLGHCPHLENPALIADRLESFLAYVGSAEIGTSQESLNVAR
jgi:pimeloyl-ACP methyl ester carboxylesterase